MINWPDVHFGPLNLWNAPNMSELKRKVQAYIITYTCDICAQGEMIPTGIDLLSSPPKYPHVCNKCGDNKVLPHKYPREVYE